ncbi:MAG: InlB B-repeat-containing protein, partial [Clostridia bacterium]|nr:InlB B-repeat-containing protein [Clostridia bacterium]
MFKNLFKEEVQKRIISFAMSMCMLNMNFFSYGSVLDTIIDDMASQTNNDSIVENIDEEPVEEPEDEEPVEQEEQGETAGEGGENENSEDLTETNNEEEMNTEDPTLGDENNEEETNTEDPTLGDENGETDTEDPTLPVEPENNEEPNGGNENIEEENNEEPNGDNENIEEGNNEEPNGDNENIEEGNNEEPNGDNENIEEGNNEEPNGEEEGNPDECNNEEPSGEEEGNPEESNTEEPNGEEEGNLDEGNTEEPNGEEEGNTDEGNTEEPNGDEEGTGDEEPINIGSIQPKGLRGGMQLMGTSPGDPTKPEITVTNISSNNANTSYAKVGNVVTLTFTTSEAVTTPTVTIDGQNASVTNVSGSTSWRATYTLTNSNNEGTLGFTVDAVNSSSVAADTVTSTSNDSAVIFDKTAPEITQVGDIVYGEVGSNLATVKININDSTTGVKLIEVSRNSGAYANATVTDFVSEQIGIQRDITVSFTQTGTYKLRLTDGAGNTSAESTITLNDSDSKVSIVTLPTKVVYEVDEALDLTGGKIKYGTTFTTGTQYDMTNAAVTVNGFDSTTSGVKTLVVTYSGKNASFDVTVNEGINYITIETNGTSELVSNAITRVYLEGLSSAEYLWSYSNSEIGTKTYTPDASYLGNSTFAFSGKKIVKNSSTGAQISQDTSSVWYYEDKTSGVIRGEIFRSPSYSKVVGQDQISRETITKSTDYPGETGVVSFDYYVSSTERYHTLDVWVNGVKVIKGASGNTGWQNYTASHTMSGGKIDIVFEYKVSGGSAVSGDNMAAIKNLTFTGKNTWKGFANGALLTTPVLGPETYLHVRGTKTSDSSTVTKVSEAFLGDVELLGIEMDTVPFQTEYGLNEDINLYGGEISLIYEGGRQLLSIDSPGVTISNFDSSEYGVCKVFVAYEDCSTYFYVTINSSSYGSSVANKPELDPGMVPVKWVDGEGWMVTTEDDKNWYDYSTDEKKWANVMLRDNLSVKGIADASDATVSQMAGKIVVSEGSMFVWIPRYTYKVENGRTGTKSITGVSGTVKTLIRWSNGTTDNTSNSYKAHPAFNYAAYNGGTSYGSGGTQLKGFWVAKFEASRNGDNVAVVADENSWTNVSIDTAFNKSKAIATTSLYGIEGSNTKSHLIKNSEWGAVAMLTNAYSESEDAAVGALPYVNNYDIGAPRTGYSGLTQDRTKVTTAGDVGRYTFAWNTTNGVKASTTGNVYGVYDLSGGASEMVAAYINNGFSSVNSNGSTLTASANAKDVDKVTGLTQDDFFSEVYSKLTNYNGFAIYEYSSGVDDDNGATMIDSDAGILPFMDLPFFARGGNYGLGSGAGAFAVDACYGDDSDDNISFRPTILITGTNSVAEATISLVRITSNNAIITVAKPGDTVVINIEATDVINVTGVQIKGHAATVSGAGRVWEASYTLTDSDTTGNVTFNISYTVNDSSKPALTSTTDSSNVIFYKPMTDSDEDITIGEGGQVVVTPSVTNPIVESLWLSGVHTAEDFENEGNTFDETIVVDENGQYTIYLRDQAGNEYVKVITVNTVDLTAPELVSASLSSNNVYDGDFAKKGDTITLTLEFNEQVTKPTVTILGRTVASNRINTTDNIHYTATFVPTASEADGNVGFSVSNYTDLSGNDGETVTETTDGSAITYDKTFVSTSVSLPSSHFTSGDDIIYTVSFADPYLEVSTIDLVPDDIEILTTGTATAIAEVLMTYEPYQREVKLTNIAGEGTLAIKVLGATNTNENPTHVIARDTAGNPAALVTSTTFEVDTVVPTLIITKTPDPDLTSGNVTVDVECSELSTLNKLRWATGEKTPDYFENFGTNIASVNSTHAQFAISTNGTYTVYAEDSHGNGIVHIVEVGNIGFDLVLNKNINAGGTVATAGIYLAGTVVEIVATPSAGYRFINWTTSDAVLANENSATTTFTMPERTVTITANFIQNLITFNANGGSGTMAQQAFVPGAPTNLNINTFTAPTGKVFEGWALTPAGDIAYADGAEIVLYENITLYAKWKYPAVAIVTSTSGQLAKTIKVKTSAATKIDWGDGTVETIPLSPAEIELTHTYTSSGTFTIRMHDDVVTSIYCNNNQITSIDVTRALCLTSLTYSNNSLTSLDVTHNTQLVHLSGADNNLTSLDLTNNTELLKLGCGNNQITSLDLTNNTKLTHIYCGNNQLTSLDVTKNVDLQILVFTDNSLTNINLTKNTALTDLQCIRNNLTSLDVSKNTALRNLHCYSNSLTSLDVSKNTELRSLTCYGNSLTSLDVRNNTDLTQLWCYNNSLTELDVSKNLLLTDLQCSNSTMNPLVVDSRMSATPSKHANTKTVTITQTPHGTIEYMGSRAFNILPDEGYSVLSLTVGGVAQVPTTSYTFPSITANTSITATYAQGYVVTYYANGGTGSMASQIFQPGVSQALTACAFTAPTGKVFDGWALTPTGDVEYTDGQSILVTNSMALYAKWKYPAVTMVANVTEAGYLEKISLRTTGSSKINWGDGTVEDIPSQISEGINLEHNYASVGTYTITIADDVLDRMYLHETLNLTSIDLTNATNLRILNVNNNQLTSIDISHNTKLQQFVCSYNQLTEINLGSSVSDLQRLDCDHNNLTTLTLNNLKNLTTLTCSYNQITALDVTKNTKLTELHCFSNQLTTLNVSKNRELRTLSCMDNLLTTLTLSTYTSSCDDLIQLRCYNNSLTSLDVSNCSNLTFLSCYSNSITNLDVSQNLALEQLQCQSNSLTSLDITKNVALTNLICSGNSLTELDLSKNLLLTSATTTQSTLNPLVIDSRQSGATISRHANTKTITITQTPHGTINYAGSRVFDILPDTGYSVISLTAGGASQPVATTYTFPSVTANTTITATFSNSYNVTFNANGGTGTMANEAFTYGVEKALTPNAFTRTHYRFLGWSTTSTGPVVYTDGQVISINIDTTLYAVWEQNEYTVTINKNVSGGGTVTPASATYYAVGSTVPISTTVNSGYVFSNWTTTTATLASTTDMATTFTMPAQNVTIQANYTATYTLTYNANSGTGTMATQTFTAGVAQKLRPNTFTRAHYDFLGWSTSNTATTATYTDEQEITISANTTLYAVWKTYTLTLAVDPSGKATLTGAGSYASGEVVPINAAPNTYYSFVNWTTTGGVITNPDSNNTYITMPKANVTATAHVVQSSFVLTTAVSPSAKGTVTVSPTHTGNYYEVGEQVTVTATPIDGYAFSSWSSSNGGTFGSATSASTTFTMPNGATTITATFVVNTAAVTFNKNNSSATGTMSNQTFTFGVPQNLTANAFALEHNRFIGWAKTSTGPVVYADGEEITISAATTLYAKWEQNEYTVTLSKSPSAGGSVIPAAATYYPVGSTVSIEATPATGYVFGNWTTTNAVLASTTDTSTTFTMPSSDVAITANFVQKKTLTVSASPSGKGTVTGGGTYAPGEVVPITATPANYYSFVNWTTSTTGAVITDPESAITYITMPNANTTVTANFVQSSFVLSTAASPSGKGTITLSPTHTDNYYAAGEQITITATPSSGYAFSAWSSSAGGTFGSATSASTTFTMPNNATTITATFVVNTAAVTFNKNNSSATGTMSNQTFTFGVPQNLTPNAFALANNEFIGWAKTATGPVVYADGEEITITAATTLYAKW